MLGEVRVEKEREGRWVLGIPAGCVGWFLEEETHESSPSSQGRQGRDKYRILT